MATNAALSSPLVLRILAASVNVSFKAGDIIRDIMKSGDLGIVEKGPKDLQTEADRAAQRCIIASLHKQFPKVAIFGEEQLDPSDQIPDDYVCKELAPDVLAHPCPDCYRDVQDEQIVIWVDPLDGTAEFTQGLLDHVTVLIGIAINGEAKAGVVYQPYYNYEQGDDAKLGRCIWGLVGLGSFGFEPKLPPADRHLITTTRSHSDWIVTSAVHACGPRGPSGDPEEGIVRVGGAGHKVLLIIEGKAHAYVFASKGCKKWDTCAPEAVLTAIGGRLTDICGNPILYHSEVQRKNLGGVLATVADHAWYTGKMTDEIKQGFESDKVSEKMKEWKLKQAQKEAEINAGQGDAMPDKNFEGSSVDPLPNDSPKL